MNALHRLQKLAAFKVDGANPLLSIVSPQARGILGGAIAGGTAGGYAGGEENRKKGILAGALAGGLGGGAIADVMANRTARGFKVGDGINLRAKATGPELDDFESVEIGKGARGLTYRFDPDLEAKYTSRGIDRGDIADHIKDKYGDGAWEASDDIRAAALGNRHIYRYDNTVDEGDMEMFSQLGDAYRNRALKRGAGALAAGGAGVLASRRDREKQASFVGGPSVIGINLEKRASVYGGAAAGGLLGAAYGHFGTKKEDRNWKRTLGHAGIGALTGGSMGLARKRGLEIGSLNEEAKGLRGNLTDLQGELASAHNTLRSTSNDLRRARASNEDLSRDLTAVKSLNEGMDTDLARLEGELREARDALSKERRPAVTTQQQLTQSTPAPAPNPEQPRTLQQRLANNRRTSKFQMGTQEGNRFNQEARARGDEMARARARQAEELKRAQDARAAQLEKEKARARQASISAVKRMKLNRDQIVDSSLADFDDTYNELASGNFRANLSRMVDEGKITEDQAAAYDALRFVSKDPARMRLRERYMNARARRDAQSKTASLMCAPSILGSAYWY